MSGNDKRKNENEGESASKKLKFTIWGRQTETVAVVKRLSELVVGKR